jgi:hypothetical protein
MLSVLFFSTGCMEDSSCGRRHQNLYYEIIVVFIQKMFEISKDADLLPLRAGYHMVSEIRVFRGTLRFL